MISSIEISRFRGIREGKLEGLTPLVVLVGPNGCGKSSVLDALSVAGTSEPISAIAQVVRRHSGVQDGPRWLFWRSAEQATAKIAVGTRKGSRSSFELRLKPGSPPNLWTIAWRFLSSEGGTQRNASGDVDFLRRGRITGSAAGQILREIPRVRLVEKPSAGIAVPLHQLYSEGKRHGRHEQTKSLLAEVVPGIKELEILTEGDTPVLYFVYEGSAVPAALAGDGIYALVHLSLELAACGGGLMLLEEPEVHQHPGAIRQSVRAILAAVRRDIQVILSTHSLELIDALLAESSDEDLERFSLYRLQLEDGRLISVRMPGPDVAFSRQDIEDDLR